jgi:hypothetical protein
MRSVTAAGLALAFWCAAPGLVGPVYAAPDNPVRATATVPARQKVLRPLKPSWERCFDMSINRGFNHDTEEWQQSIIDCMDGKIPL